MAWRLLSGLIFSLPATETGWRESGPVEINGFLLPNSDSSHYVELSIGQELFLTCKPLLHWNVLKACFPFLVFKLIEWLVACAGKKTLPGTTPVPSVPKEGHIIPKFATISPNLESIHCNHPEILLLHYNTLKTDFSTMQAMKNGWSFQLNSQRETKHLWQHLLTAAYSPHVSNKISSFYWVVHKT